MTGQLVHPYNPKTVLKSWQMNALQTEQLKVKTLLFNVATS